METESLHLIQNAPARGDVVGEVLPGRTAHEAREPKVTELDAAVLVHQHVLRLDVTVHHRL